MALDIAVEAALVLALHDAALTQVVPFAKAGALLAGERAARVLEGAEVGHFRQNQGTLRGRHVFAAGFAGEALQKSAVGVVVHAERCLVDVDAGFLVAGVHGQAPRVSRVAVSSVLACCRLAIACSRSSLFSAIEMSTKVTIRLPTVLAASLFCFCSVFMGVLHFQHLGDLVEEGGVFGGFDRVVDGVGWRQGGAGWQAVEEVAWRRPVGHFGAETAKGVLNAGNVCGLPIPPRQRLQPYLGNSGDRFAERADGRLPLRPGRRQLANRLAEIVGTDTDGGKLAAESAGRVLELAHHRRYRRTGAAAVKTCVGQLADIGGGFFEGEAEGVRVWRGVAHRQAHAGGGLCDVAGGVSEFEAVTLCQRQHRRQRFDGFAAFQAGAGEIFQRLRCFRSVIFSLCAHLLGGGAQRFHFLGRRARDGLYGRELRLKICRATDRLVEKILDFPRDKGDAERRAEGDDRAFQAVKRANVALGIFACLVGRFREVAQTARVLPGQGCPTRRAAARIHR